MLCENNLNKRICLTYVYDWKTNEWFIISWKYKKKIWWKNTKFNYVTLSTLLSTQNGGNVLWIYYINTNQNSWTWRFRPNREIKNIKFHKLIVRNFPTRISQIVRSSHKNVISSTKWDRVRCKELPTL